MSPELHFAEHTLQEAALVIMACVYSLRLYWILHFKAGRERQAANPNGRTTSRRGITYSLFNIAMPWAMESTRTKWLFYVQFVLFHLGVTVAILLSFFIPYAPDWLEAKSIVQILQVILGLAFIVAVVRVIRRIFQPMIRAISTPDDYFSLLLLTVWMLLAFLSAGNPVEKETLLLAYFWMTAFFLIYVPFSKISHYLYYPFTRYYLGRTMGRRGVFPLELGR